MFTRFRVLCILRHVLRLVACASSAVNGTRVRWVQARGRAAALLQAAIERGDVEAAQATARRMAMAARHAASSASSLVLELGLAFPWLYPVTPCFGYR